MPPVRCAAQFVQAHARKEDGSYSSRDPHLEHVQTHQRRDYQRRDGQGWSSKLHPKVLDYRTVDELGMHPDELDVGRKPAKPMEKLEIVKAEYMREEEQGRAKPARMLENGKKAYGLVRQFRYEYFKITVPHKNVTIKLMVSALSGDPDIFVCNRNANPQRTAHTWKSAGAGDDSVVVRPDDPLFFTGPYFIGVYGVYDSEFEICASLVRQPVQVTRRAVRASLC